MNADYSDTNTTAKGCAIYDALGLTALALAYRTAFLLAMPRVLDTADAIHYAETAATLAQGDFFGYNPKIPILYPLLSALAHGCIPDIEWACRMVSFVASILLIPPLYFLARAVFDRRCAVLGGLAIALHPWFADYGCRVSTESTALLWWFLGAFLLYCALKQGKCWTLLPAFPFLALYLTRPEGLMILVAAPLAAMVLGGKNWRSSLLRLLPYAVLSLSGIVLNVFYVRALSGVATTNYRVGFILQEFDYLRFVDTTAKTLTEVLPLMLGPVLLLFLGVGLFRPTPQRRFSGEVYLLLLAGAQWGVSLFVLSPAPRYLMAPIIVLTLCAARGMMLVEGQAKALPRARCLRHLPLLALIGALLFHTAVTVGSEHLGRRPREPREYKDAGLWMREHLETGLLFSRKPQIGFYAQMPSTGPALDDSLQEALQRAQEAGARYLAVDERYAPVALRPLLDPKAAPDSLVFLQEFNAYPESKVLLYEFKPPLCIKAAGD